MLGENAHTQEIPKEDAKGVLVAQGSELPAINGWYLATMVNAQGRDRNKVHVVAQPGQMPLSRLQRKIASPPLLATLSVNNGAVSVLIIDS